MEVPASLAEVAEDLVAWLPTPVLGSRLDTPWGVLRHAGRHGRDFCNVVRVRLEPDEVPEALEQARSWFAERGQQEHAWWIGPSATPDDLEARLQDLGLVPDPEQAETTAMVLTDDPAAPVRPGVEVRRVSSADDLRTLLQIDAAVWRLTDEDLSTLFDDLEGQWERMQAAPGRSSFLAYLDGTPAAYGTLVMTGAGAGALLGGSTLEQARGRGLYQALVQARWDAAVAAGASGLVVQASEMSRPVLERMGFRAKGVVRLWAQL